MCGLGVVLNRAGLQVEDEMYKALWVCRLDVFFYSVFYRKTNLHPNSYQLYQNRGCSISANQNFGSELTRLHAKRHMFILITVVDTFSVNYWFRYASFWCWLLAVFSFYWAFGLFLFCSKLLVHFWTCLVDFVSSCIFLLFLNYCFNFASFLNYELILISG